VKEGAVKATNGRELQVRQASQVAPQRLGYPHCTVNSKGEGTREKVPEGKGRGPFRAGFN